MEKNSLAGIEPLLGYHKGEKKEKDLVLLMSNNHEARMPELTS
jgi:hypothetical protein